MSNFTCQCNFEILTWQPSVQINYFQIEENDIEDEQEIERIMEEFYRTYLLSNKENFNRYSKEWRNANIKLIYLSLRAKKSRASKKLWDSVAFMR